MFPWDLGALRLFGLHLDSSLTMGASKKDRQNQGLTSKCGRIHQVKSSDLEQTEKLQKSEDHSRSIPVQSDVKMPRSKEVQGEFVVVSSRLALIWGTSGEPIEESCPKRIDTKSG